VENLRQTFGTFWATVMLIGAIIYVFSTSAFLVLSLFPDEPVDSPDLEHPAH
jgi:hypothetical protein